MRPVVEPFSAAAARNKHPWWLWLNLLAFDAPLVAVLWQTLLARCFGVNLRMAEPLLLGLVCWFVYAADYLWDGWSQGSMTTLAPRHEFFRQHRPFMLVVLSIVAVTICALIFQLRPIALGAGCSGGVAVIGYLALTHLTPLPWRKRWPRELAVALLFSGGTFLCVWADLAEGRSRLLAPALIFALLCWINVAGIEAWEAGHSAGHLPSASGRWLARHSLTAVVTVVGCTVGLLCLGLLPELLAVVAVLSGAGFFLLHVQSSKLSTSLLRMGADAALFLPALAVLLSGLR